MKTNNNPWQRIIGNVDPSACMFAGTVSDADIKSFEQESGYTLPEDYRRFVREFGCGSIGSVEILGLGIKPTGIPSLVWLLKNLDRMGLTPPASILPVSPLGDGTYAAVLCNTKGAFTKGTVVRWTPGAPGAKLEVLGSSFSAYLAEMVAQ